MRLAASLRLDWRKWLFLSLSGVWVFRDFPQRMKLLLFGPFKYEAVVTFYKQRLLFMPPPSFYSQFMRESF